MRRSKYPDTLRIWGHTWTHTKGRRGWIGPAITEPEDPMLALAVEYERIIRKDGHYVMVDPSITLNRFGWTEDDAKGLIWEDADGRPISGDDGEEAS